MPGAPGASGSTPAASGATDGTPAASGATDGNPYRSVLALTVLILLGLLATAGARSYRDLESARGHEQKLLEEIAETQERIRALNGRIDSISNDPVMLERLAREDLGLVRAGDVVIILPEELPAVSAPMVGRAAPANTD